MASTDTGSVGGLQGSAVFLGSGESGPPPAQGRWGATSLHGSPPTPRRWDHDWQLQTNLSLSLRQVSTDPVSVATLFRRSILRSSKATQLTSATDARFNAEAAIEMYPNIIKNPVNPNFSVAALGNVATVDPPLTTNTPNYIIDPLGFAAVAGI